jgi:hypothetical protein
MGTSIFTGSSGFDVQKVIDGFVKIEGVRSEKLQQKTIDVTTRMSTLVQTTACATSIHRAGSRAACRTHSSHPRHA